MKKRKARPNTPNASKFGLGLTKETVALVCRRVLDEIRDMQIFTEMGAHRFKICCGKKTSITAKITRDLPVIIKDAILEIFIIFIRVVKKIRGRNGITTVTIHQKRLSYRIDNPAMVPA